MDTDGSGTVDYNEFVVAMTTDLSEGLKGTKGTQSAFFEFANINKRNNVLERITDQSTPPMTRYKHFSQLFSMTYIPPSEQELSPEEELAKIAADSKREMGERSKKIALIKHKELFRARFAEMVIKNERKLRHNAASSIDHFEELSHTEKAFLKRMAKFSNHTANSTYIDISSSRGTASNSLARGQTGSILAASRNGCGTMLPPVSLRKVWSDIERSRVEDDEATADKNDR
jgi:hypothetical protein